MPKKKTAIEAPTTPATAAPEVSEIPQWTPPENPNDIVTDESAPKEALHSYAENFTQLPKEQQEPLLDNMKKLAALPNVGSNTIEKLYSHYHPEKADAVGGHLSPHSRDEDGVIGSLAASSNAPASVKEDYLRRHAGDDDKTFQLPEIGNAVGVDPKVLEAVTLHQIDNPNIKYFPSKFKHHPDFAFGLLQGRRAPEPDAGNLNEGQKLHNQKIEKLDRVVSDALIHTDKHTPETLERTVRLLTDPDARPEGMSDFRKDFIATQPNLTSPQLDRMWQSDMNASDARDSNSNILDHPNVDPALIARVAQDAGLGNDWHAQNIQAAAIRNPKLPEETRRQMVSNLIANPAEHSSDIVRNPSVTPEELQRLNATNRPSIQNAVIAHPNTPDSILKSYWESSGKSTNAAHDLLNRSTLPESIWKDLVNHKNKNIAIEAVQHKGIPASALEIAAQRKMPAVADLAAKHPLIADRYFAERAMSGKMKGSEFFGNKANIETAGARLPEIVKSYSDRYKAATPESIKATKDDELHYYGVNYRLAQNGALPAKDRNQHAKNVSDYFLKQIPALPEEQNRIGGRGFTDEQKKSIDMVKDLANQGQVSAEAALLSRPRLFRNVIDADEIQSPEFLDKIHKSVKASNLGEGEKQEIYRDIANNPRTPLKLFESIANQKEFLKNSRNYQHSDRVTSFDTQYAHLPEADRRARFSWLAENENGGHEAVVRSGTAPKDLWRQSFQQLSNDQIAGISGSTNIAAGADPETYRELLLGTHNYKGDDRWKRGSALKPQIQAVQELNQNRIPDYLQMLAQRKSGGDHGLDANMLMSQIPENFFQGEVGKQAALATLKSDPDLGARALLKHAYVSGWWAEDPNFAANFIDATKNTPAEPVDGQTPNYIQAKRWMSLLNQNHQTTPGFKQIFPALFRNAESGSMNFLADLPNDGPESDSKQLTDTVRSLASINGLITNQKMQELIGTDPDEFDKSLRSADTKSRDKRVRAFIDQQSVDPRFADKVVNHVDNGTLNPHSGPRHTIGDEGIQTSKAYAIKLTDHLLQSGNSRAALRLASNIAQGQLNPKNGGLNLEGKKTVIKGILDRVQASGMSDDEKNQFILSAHKVLQRGDRTNPYVPKSMVSGVAKWAVKNNAIGTLLTLADRDDAPAGVITQIVRIAATKPELISEKDWPRISLMMQGNPSIENVKKISSAVIAQVARIEAMQPGVAQSLLCDHLDGLRAAAAKSDSSAVSSYAWRTIKPYLRSPDQEVTRIATDQAVSMISSNTSMPVDDKQDAFISLPDTGSAALSAETGIRLPADVMNRAAVIENATSGWKLKSVVNKYNQLEPKFTSTIINRVIAAPDTEMDAKEKSRIATTALTGVNDDNKSNTSDEDAIRLFRSLSPESKWNTLDSVARSSQFNGHLSTSKSLAIIPHALDELADIAVGKLPLPGNQTPGSADHTNAVLSHVDNVIQIANSYSQTSDLVDMADRQSEIGPQVHKALGILESLIDRPGVIWNDLLNALHKFAGVRRHDDGVSVRLMSISKKIAVPNGNFMRGWAKNADLSAEEWGPTLQETPEIVFAMQNMQSVPVHAVALVKPAEFLQANQENLRTATNALAGILPTVTGEGSQEACDTIIDGTASHLREHPDSAYEFLQEALGHSPERLSRSQLNVFRDIIATKNIADWNALAFRAIGAGAGGSEFYNQVINEGFQGDKVNPDWTGGNEWDLLAKSASITSEAAPIFQKMLTTVGAGPTIMDQKKDVVEALAANPKSPKAVVKTVLNFIEKHKTAFDAKPATISLCQNPALDREDFQEFYDKTKDSYPAKFFEAGSRFHPALLNAKFGGTIFRSLSLHLPETIPNIDQAKLPVEFEYSKGRNRIKEAMQHIPPEGITWAAFKRVFKKGEQYPEVKAMFMAANNKPLMPEDAVNELKKHDDGRFHLTYSRWKSDCQRHRGGCPGDTHNLVIQQNTSAAMESQLNQDPKLWNLFQYIQKSANNTRDDQNGGHPVTPHIASWIRIDTGDKDSLIVEEFQSDFGARLYDQIEKLRTSHPNGCEFDGHHYTVDEMLSYGKQIEKTISGWHEASMKGLEEFAKAQGKSHIYIHGENVRARMSFGESQGTKENPIWLQKMYKNEPPKWGYEKCDYSEYPIKNDDFRATVKGDPYCWKKKVS